MHTCRIILFTSLVWFLLDVAILFYYSDSPTTSGNSVGVGQHGPVSQDLIGFPGVQADGVYPAKQDTLNLHSNTIHQFSADEVNLKKNDEVICQVTTF